MGSKGQSLIELVIVVALTVLVVGALTAAAIVSLRNSTLARSQIQATKLAQGGLEKVKTIRDQNGNVSYTDGTSNASKFSDLWQITFDCQTLPNCYFFLTRENLKDKLQSGNNTTVEPIPDSIFERQILIEGSGVDSKQVTAVVKWKDYAGEHESRLTTILGKR